jgi:hypothetical protein
MKEEMLKRLEALSQHLPANTLDQLIDELGGPENVSEMTGRKGRVVQDEKGDVRYESRSEQDIPLETLNLTEKDRFMRGEKDVAIISEAASSGISLQVTELNLQSYLLSNILYNFYKIDKSMNLGSKISVIRL